MNTAELPEKLEIPPPETGAVQRRAFGPRAWLLLGLSALGVWLWAKWDWLAAAGLAPIIIAMLPCAVMCALGVCMHRFMPHAKAGTCRTQSGLMDEAGDRK